MRSVSSAELPQSGGGGEKAKDNVTPKELASICLTKKIEVNELANMKFARDGHFAGARL